MIAELHRAGADAFRVNMSHGDHAGHAKVIAAIRALEFKCDVLWVQLDALYYAYVDPKMAYPGKFVPKD